LRLSPISCVFFSKLYLLSYKRLKEKEKTLQKPIERCCVRQYLIDRHQIHYLRFIMEAYPGIAVVSTVDSALGLVCLAIAPGCEPEIVRILEAEREILKLREVFSEKEQGAGSSASNLFIDSVVSGE
jgi:hypothetical protein